MSQLTITELAGILHECGGAEELVEDYGEFAETSFVDLGYDSLVLLEAVSRVRRDYGVVLSDDDIVGTSTPGELLGLVRRRMVEAA